MKTKFLIVLASMSLMGCPKRAEIRAEMWLNSGLPEDICERAPELKQFGMYRKLNTGKYEFLAYCRPESAKYFGISEKRFNELLDELLPKGK